MPLINYSLILFLGMVVETIVSTKYDYQSPQPGAELKENSNFALNVSNKHSIATIHPARHATAKKWQVGRVSRKQYEIINMLWRKTNVFKDEENFSPRIHKMRETQPPISITMKKSVLEFSKPPPPVLQLSTMSFIEFYYLDEYLDSSSAKPDKVKDVTKNSNSNLDKLGKFMQRSPAFTLRFNDAAYRISKFGNNLLKNNVKSKQTTNAPQVIKSELNVFNSYFLQNILGVKKDSLQENDVVLTTVTSLVRNSPFPKRYATQSSTASPLNNMISVIKNATAANDKIKFFEMYDSATHSPKKSLSDDIEIDDLDSVVINDIEGIKKVLLEDVDNNVGHGPNKVRNVKKHIESLKTDKDDKHGELATTQQTTTTNITIQSKRTTSPATYYIEKETPRPSDTFTWDISLGSNTSRPVPWSKYPFVAVYVYERFQVHCDAAIISPHWLVASAACLSRHREDPNGEERSAFVTFCGETWWNPERITYVKYFLVHPRFHPKDVTRRSQYNIGVINVVTSMSMSCPNWSPISTMSHQYVAELEGTIGTAIGWGLDRYDTSYSSTDLPRHPLSMYESILYSNTCPGNNVIRTTETVRQEAVRNVYCLSLPPYSEEDRDPVHGGLLLVGGKLIALFLQEERRRWGEQSAQYTGIWRLIPWVNDVAKEPEEIDFSL